MRDEGLKVEDSFHTQKLLNSKSHISHPSSLILAGRLFRSPTIYYPQLQTRLSIVLILLNLENKIDGLFFGEKLVALIHSEADAGECHVVLPHHEAQVLFFYDS